MIENYNIRVSENGKYFLSRKKINQECLPYNIKNDIKTLEVTSFNINHLAASTIFLSFMKA